MQRTTFSEFMAMLARMPKEIEAAAVEGLTESAVRVHKTAVQKFGEYQPTVGPYPGWAPLQPETVREKVRAGAKGDDPLIGYSTGTQRRSVYPTSLRQSLTMDVRAEELAAYVGTNDPIGMWQEFGTSRGIPPRPFLRPALYQNEDWIKRIMRDAIGMGLFSSME